MFQTRHGLKSDVSSAPIASHHRRPRAVSSRSPPPPPRNDDEHHHLRPLGALHTRMETNVSRIVLTNDSSYNATIVTTASGYNLVESIAMCLILGGIIITTIIGKQNVYIIHVYCYANFLIITCERWMTTGITYSVRASTNKKPLVWVEFALRTLDTMVSPKSLIKLGLF